MTSWVRIFLGNYMRVRWYCVASSWDQKSKPTATYHLRSWRHGKGKSLTNIEHVTPFQWMAQHHWNELMNCAWRNKLGIHTAQSQLWSTHKTPASQDTDLYQNWPCCPLHNCTQLSSHFSARFPAEPLSDFLSLSLKRAAGPETHENA